MGCVNFDWELLWDRCVNPARHPGYPVNLDGTATIHKRISLLFDTFLFIGVLFIIPVIFCGLLNNSIHTGPLGKFVLACMFFATLLLSPLCLLLAHEGYLNFSRSVYAFISCNRDANEEDQTASEKCSGKTVDFLCCASDPSKKGDEFVSTNDLDKQLLKSFTYAYSTSIVLIVFVFLCFLLFWKPLTAGYDSSDNGAPLELKPVTLSTLDRPNYAAYPICNSRWLDAELDVYDLAMFANIAYADDNSTDHFLQLGYSDWHRDSTRSYSRVRYHVFSNNVTAEHLVAVRGTEVTADWFQNAQLWGQAIVYQMTIGQLFEPPLVTVSAIQHIVQATGVMFWPALRVLS